MSGLTALRTYAQKLPTELPPSILHSHNDHTLTIYDAYPKSIFHFLILPRPSSEASLSDLSSLKYLLRHDKTVAKEVVTQLRADALALRKEIEEEMLKRYGFRWGVWTGFHGTPSMEHLHLHVLSADLCSPKMKNKKHYNSFSPKAGFFLDVDEVLSWFDAEPSYFASKAKLEKGPYEALLKQDLVCFHCGESKKNIPQLKEHLQEEWDKLEKREKARQERKRKLEDRKKPDVSSTSKKPKLSDTEVIQVSDGE